MESTFLQEDQVRAYQSARENIANHRYEQAILELTPVVQTHPLVPGIGLLLAKAFLHESRFDDASRVLSTLMKQHSENPEVLLYFAQLCYHYDDKVSYKKTLSRIVELNSPTYEVSTLLAKSYLFRAESDFELEYLALRKALDLSPNNYDILSAIPFSMIKTGRLREAENTVTDLLVGYPDSVSNLILLAEIAWVYGDLSKSETLLVKAQAISPQNSDVASRLNRIYWRTGKFGKVFGVIRRVYGI